MSDDMACKEIVEMLSDYLEGALGPHEHAHVQDHLAGCDGCARVLDQLRTTMQAVGRLTEERLSVAS